MQIRNAHIDDVDRLSDYILWGQGIHVEAYPDVFAPVDKDAAKTFLIEYLDSKTSYLRVVEWKATIVGFTFIQVLDLSGSLIRLPRRLAYLDLIAVDSQYQRRGIGSALLADTLKIAKSQGIERIELDVMGFNKGARRFFSSQGFSELGYRMYYDKPIA